MKTTLLLLLLLALTQSPAHGEFIQLIFMGDVASGAKHDFVTNGESYAATFIVDDSIPDSDASETTGEYLGSVVHGRFVFSGGYSSEVSFQDLHVFVSDDVSGLFDGVTIRTIGNLGFFVSSASMDLDTLDSDEFPGVGQLIDGNGALTFLDDFGTIITSNTTTSLLVDAFVLGDVNGDNVVDLLDVGPFVDLLISGQFAFQADANLDGMLNLTDVGPFIDLLTD